RRPSETMTRLAPPAARPGVPLPAFDGIFDGEMSDGTGTLPVRAILRRQHDRVSGVYSFGGGPSEISGLVERDALVFVCPTGGQSGRGRVRAVGDGRFSGARGPWGVFGGGRHLEWGPPDTALGQEPRSGRRRALSARPVADLL